MYRNLLPHDINPHKRADSDLYTGHLKASPHYPLARAVRAGARRVGTALRRPVHNRGNRSRNTTPSMSWWD